MRGSSRKSPAAPPSSEARFAGAAAKSASNRQWAAPAGPHLMEQVWHDLLFAHWTVPVATLRPLVPRELELDTREGAAWVAVTPFRMTGVRQVTNTVWVTWESVPGWSYSAEASPTVSGPWGLLPGGPMTATNVTSTVSIPMSDAQQRFIRVHLVQP